MKKLFAFSAVLLVAAGCRSTVNMTGPAEDRSRVAAMDERVTTDKGLQRKARVEEVRESQVQGGLMKAQVRVRNTTSKPRRINCRFLWFDADGMRIETSLSSWRPKTLHGGESVWIDAVAPTAEASDFRFKMIEGKR